MSKHFLGLTIFFFSLVIWGQSEDKSFRVNYIEDVITVDGDLSETVWKDAEIANDFLQYFPTDTLRAVHQTEIKMLVSSTTLYIAITQYNPNDYYIVPTLERDYRAGNSDNISLLFDTFNDGTNAFLIGINPYGVRREALIAGGGASFDNFITAWDVKWKGESKIYDTYYTSELAIPLTSFKFTEGETKWRFQSYRFNAQTNERSVWVRIPQNQTLTNLAFMGDMIFEKPLGKSRTPMAVIPYINALASKDYAADQNITDFQLGGDAKVSIGNSMNLDITLNPDFSNVEVDDIFTNLTRFEINLPERRQFFIDNADLFGGFGQPDDANPFFSRRIGIARDTAGNTIQNRIIGGVRLSGKLNENWRMGLFSIQTDEDIPNEIPSNNNSMIALQKKVFARSNFGFFFINRQSFKDYEFQEPEEEYNRVVGFDYNLATVDNKWQGKAYVHKSWQPGNKTGNFSAGGFLQRNTRYWNILANLTYVDDDFKSDLGFIPRKDIIRVGTAVDKTFWPKKGLVNNHTLAAFGQAFWRPTFDYKKTDHFFRGAWEFEMLNLSEFELEFFHRFVFLTRPFDPTGTEGAIPLPADVGYYFNTVSFEFRSNQANMFAYEFDTQIGRFFNGNQFSIEGNATLRIQPKVLLRMNIRYDQIRLPDPYSDADLWLFSPSAEITFSKSIFWSTIFQYSNQRDNLGINSRLQWRFAPLSDLFLVYNDNYFVDRFAPRFRSINLKLTYWLNI